MIDDVNGQTLVSASTKDAGVANTGTKSDQAKSVGKLLGERALAKDISSIVFDRAGYLHHGRVKSLADGAREAGLSF